MHVYFGFDILINAYRLQFEDFCGQCFFVARLVIWGQLYERDMNSKTF